MDMLGLSALDMVQHIRSGELSALELTEAALDRVTKQNPTLNAALFVDREGALAQASAIDRARAAGHTLPSLAGVPVLLKDNLCTKGMPTTCASRILEGYFPPYDAHVVERLRSCGAVLLGKTNMDEFAMGSSNENSAFGAVRNPWKLDHAPGGSSGGSAAAVAAEWVPLSLGSDTGGSVRQPGSFCGVVALKPTYGRVSRYGLVAFASSLDQIGPFARTVEDAALLLQCIAGHDVRDATSVPRQVPTYQGDLGVGKLRVGIVRGEDTANADEDVQKTLNEAAAALQSEGATLVDCELPHSSLGAAVYYVVAPAEASSNLARFDGMRFGLRVKGEGLLDTYKKTRSVGFGAEVKRRIMLGTYALSAGYYDAYYVRAQQVRTLIVRDFANAFAKADLLIMPTSPTPAFRLGEKTNDPLSMYLSDLYTLPASLAGLPAIHVPCGMTQTGLPLGAQLIAPAFAEERLFSAAKAIERTLWNPRPKPVL